jgi:hypothetical protein
VYTTGNQTIGGIKTFSSAIVGDITGNAATATTATTATTASSVTNGVYTVGDQTIGGTKTFSVNPILSAGTVNAILSLNGSKQISAVSGLIWDGTKSNLSLGGVTVGQGNVPSLNNIAFGPSVLNAITTGYSNIGIGNNTLNVVTTGYFNVAIGSQSGQSLTTGFYNVFIGGGAGLSATTCSRNIAIGSDAGIALTTGQSNVVIGAAAGYTLVAGDGNTFVGDGAGYSHRGSNNVYIGSGAGGSLNGTGLWNTSIGYNAGGGGGTSTYNTCIGHEAGKSLVNAGSNTLVGVKAGDQIQLGQANTVIGRFNGNQSSLDIRTTDNNIVLSDGAGNPRCYYDGPNNAWIWRTGASERMRIDSTGNVAFSAGTAAAPALTTIGDLDTGVFFPAANTWAVATGGSERMRIDSTGNVGIGTTGPNSALDIYRASATTVYVTTGNTSASWLTGVAAGGDYDIYSNNASNIKFSNNGSERMRITSGGNVGIGTTSPAVRLEVAGQIRTEAPTGGTAANWRLGTVHTVSPTSPNRTIEVDIGGTIYYLHAKTTNN